MSDPKAHAFPSTPHCLKTLWTTLLFPQSFKLLKFPFIPQLKVPSSLLIQEYFGKNYSSDSIIFPILDLLEIPSLESTNSLLNSAPRSTQVRTSHCWRSPLPRTPLLQLSGKGSHCIYFHYGEKLTALLFITEINASKMTA